MAHIRKIVYIENVPLKKNMYCDDQSIFKKKYCILDMFSKQIFFPNNIRTFINLSLESGQLVNFHNSELGKLNCCNKISPNKAAH